MIYTRKNGSGDRASQPPTVLSLSIQTFPHLQFLVTDMQKDKFSQGTPTSWLDDFLGEVANKWIISVLFYFITT